MTTPARGGFRLILVRAALAFSTPILLGAYSLFPQLFFLPYVALVPWILLFTDDRNAPASFWWFPVAGWTGIFFQYTEIARFGWFAPVLMGIALLLLWLPFPILLGTIHRAFRWPRAVSFPIVWVALEWFRITFTIAHLDFYTLGYSQAPLLPLAQIADITGVYGVSFLVAMVDGLAADIIAGWLAARAGVADPARKRRNWRWALITAGAFVVAFAYGIARLASAHNAAGPRLALVQPDIEHSERNTVGIHLSEVLYTDDRVRPGTADLIVWPENAILDNVRRPGIYLPDLAWLSREKGALLLVGGMGKAHDAPGRTTNMAYLVDGEGNVLGETGKQVLFPWSEFIPGDVFLKSVAPPLWRLQRRLVRLAWGFFPTGTPVSSTQLLSMPWKGEPLPFGVLICLENAVPPIPAEAARRGARFLVNITSEQKIGGPVQEQLLRISKFRAIENRIPFVRCGNSGISGFIDAQGRSRSILRGEHGGTISDRGVLVDRVILSRGPVTWYARSHDAFALACVLGTLAAFGLAVRRRFGRAAAAFLAAALLAAPGCDPPPMPGHDAAAAAAGLAEGRALLARADAKGAIAPLGAACGAPDPCREAIPLLSSAFLLTRRFEDAEAFFGALAASRPELRAQALAERGRFLDLLADLRAAERVTAEAAELGQVPAVWAALGTLRMRMDQPAAAIEAYGRALALTPDDPQMRYLHARALWLSGRADEASSEIRALLSDHPDHGAAWAVLGRLRAAAGDASGAQEAYRNAVRGDPENVEARLMLSRAAMVAGDRNEAVRLLGEIWEINTRAVAAAGAKR